MMDTGKIYDAGMVTWQKHHGRVDASDLDLEPGKFPPVIYLRSPRTGTVKGFLRIHAFRMADEFGGYTYGTPDHLVLDVHND